MKKSLKRLVIDSATPYLYLGIFEGDRPIEQYHKKGKNDHSVTLMANLETMFARHGLSIDDIDAIIVGHGPGSYTGVRIGVVVAKMLAWSNNIPLYPVSSLALIATAAPRNTRVLSVFEARRGYAFLGLYDRSTDGLTLYEEDQYVHLTTFREENRHDIELHTGAVDMAVLLNSGLLIEADNVHLVAPVYLRKTEAERTLKGETGEI